MPATRHSGVPSARAILAPTAAALPADGARLTFVPTLPLVPVRDIIAAAAVTGATVPVLWLEPAAGLGSATDETALWAQLAEALNVSDPHLDAVRDALRSRPDGLHLVVVIAPTLSSAVDAGLIALLDAAPTLRVTAIAGGRRPLESAALTRPDGRVLASADLVVDAAGIREYASTVGLDLTPEEAGALARTAAALPDLLPAVVASAVGGLIDQPGSRLSGLESEASFALASRLAITSDEELRLLLPFAVPYLLTPSAVAAVDPEGRSGLHLPSAAAAGLIDRDADAGGYRVRLALRSAVLPELERRLADDVRPTT